MSRTGTTDSHSPGITFAGHSHVVSLGPPVHSANGVKAEPLPGHPHHRVLRGPWPRDGEYWKACLLVASRQVLALSWMGNQHIGAYLIAPEPQMDFVSSGLPELECAPTARIVPELALRQQFEPSLLWLRRLLALAAGAELSSRIVLLGTPRPKGDNQALHRFIQSEPAFRRFAAGRGLKLENVQLSLPLFRLKLWDLLQRMMHELADEFGCRFCPSPDETADEAGFLHRDYWLQDSSHGNRRYGTATIRSLQDLLGQPA